MSYRAYAEALQQWRRSRLAYEEADRELRSTRRSMESAWGEVERLAKTLTDEERLMAVREQFHGSRA